MAVTLNSTFIELPLIDKAALAIPHVLYSSIPFPKVASCAVVILLATILLLAGSYATVSQPRLAKDPIEDKKSPLWDPTDRDQSSYILTLKDDLDVLDLKTIGPVQATLFPIFAASALFGLDYVIRKMNLSVIRLLNYYVIFNVGVSSLYSIDFIFTAFLRNFAHWLQLPKNLGYFFHRYRLTLSKADDLPLSRILRVDAHALGVSESKFDEIEQFMWDTNHAHFLRLPTIKTRHQRESWVFDFKQAIVFPVALLVPLALYWYNPSLRQDYELQKINWIVNNISAVSLAIFGCIFVKIGTFKVGVLLLSLLFVYDIYFVFRSGLMISVATGIDLPFKLVFPQSPLEIFPLKDIASSTVSQLQVSESLLGLGDIVVPAAFASLALRFDYYQYYARTGEHFHKLRSIGVPKYFVSAAISYIIALLATLGSLHLSGHGQPALLFIVPLVIGGVFGMAYCRGELTEMWNYSEELKSFPKERLQESEGKAEEVGSVPKRIVQSEIIYEFGDVTDESDDTYVIEDETEPDDESEEEDLATEIANLVKDQNDEIILLD